MRKANVKWKVEIVDQPNEDKMIEIKVLGDLPSPAWRLEDYSVQVNRMNFIINFVVKLKEVRGMFPQVLVPIVLSKSIKIPVQGIWSIVVNGEKVTEIKL